MASLYGNGNIKEVVKGKRYYITLPVGKDPLSGRVYTQSGRIPDNARAIGADGKEIKPRVVYGKATTEKRASYDHGGLP